jgi:hypothetical protein
MRLPKRDVIATVVVAAAALVYLLWAVDAALPGLGSARLSGLVVLGLGFVASASAVVPTFTALLHGDKAYLLVTSLIGTAALAGGVVTLLSASAWSFALMIAATVVLWLISTVRHTKLAHAAAQPACPSCGRPVRQLHCDVCGYDLIEQARDKALGAR